MASENDGVKKEEQYLSEYEKEYKNLSKFYEEYIYPLYSKYWKSYLKDDSDRRKFLKDWQTNIHTSMTQKMVDVMFSSLYDAKTGYSVVGRNQSSREKVLGIRGYLDYLFEINGGAGVIEDATQHSMVTGTSFIKVGWDEKNVTVKREEKGIMKEYSIDSRNNPAFWNISPFFIKLDPSASSLQNSEYVYESSYMKKEQAFEKYKILFRNYLKSAKKYTVGMNEEEAFMSLLKTKKEDPNKQKTRAQYSKNKNYDLIRQKILMAKGRKACNQEIVGTEASSGFGLSLQNTVVSTSNLDFYFQDGVCEFIERWTDKKFTLFIEGLEIFSCDNPTPYGQKPYVQTFFKRIAGTVFGVGIPGTVDDLQDIDNIMANLKLDSSKIFGVPAFKRVRSTNLGAMYEDESSLQVSPGKVFDVDDKDSLTPLFTSGSYSNLSVLKDAQFDLDRDAKESVGVNEYILGAQGKVERSAAGVDALLQSFRMRLRPYITSLNWAMAEVARMWLAMTIAWGDSTIPIKVGGDIGYDIEEIDLVDIIGQYIFSFNIDGLSELTKNMDKDNLNRLVPLISNLFYDPKTQEEIISVKKFILTVLQKNDINPEDIMSPDLSSSGIGRMGDPNDVSLEAMIAELQAQGIYPPGASIPSEIPGGVPANVPSGSPVDMTKESPMPPNTQPLPPAQ